MRPDLPPDVPDNDNPEFWRRQLEDALHRMAALPPDQREALRREYDAAVMKAQRAAHQQDVGGGEGLDLQSKAALESAARLAEAKAIGEARPDESTTLRTATLEQMFFELRAQIGPMSSARSCVYIGYAEADGDIADGVRVVQYCHGTKELAATVLADILAKMPQAMRTLVADYEAALKHQAAGESAIVQKLPADRLARKAANRAKRSLPPSSEG